MAISIIQQPASIKGALSSMIYQASDTANVGNTGFYFEYKIYVWSGTTSIPATPIATIQRLPDVFAGNRSFIDISKLVNQYISDEWFSIGTASPTVSTGAVYCAVKIQGFWYVGTTLTSDAQVTSNVILATKGYEYTYEGFNQTNTKRVLTDRTIIYLTEDTFADYLWYDATKITTITIGATTITPSAVANSSNYIQSIELKNKLTAAGLWGMNCNIVFNYSGGSQTIAVEFDCVNKYGCQTLFFKNKYGVIEALSMNALSKIALTTSNESYYKGVFAQSNLADAWSYGVRIKSLYNVQGIYKQLANTNWIDESYVEIIQQILLSTICYLPYNGTIMACQITDTAMDKKTYKNDKLIMYTLNFEFAQPLINSIVR
jgi:hypothetical protein